LMVGERLVGYSVRRFIGWSDRFAGRTLSQRNMVHS
jgi:hypothetical protein